MMPKKKYTEKQMKIARVAEPRDEITGADFEVLRKADGGMVRYEKGGDVSFFSLEEKLKRALEAGNDELVEEIESDIVDRDKRRESYKSLRQTFKAGGSVSVEGMGRGCGAAVKGKKFSGTY
jgi:hypothetical protein|tara:strand:- start:2999 stop:3364 length:366 start_codon:yes stop_codon:yes gene_type:complete